MLEDKITELIVEPLIYKITELMKEVLEMLSHENRKSGKLEVKEKFITREEVCELLKISHPTLTKRMNDGTIKFIRVGRRVLFDKNNLI
ncbi:helix-turn-helix domain-containing protein [Pseudopedobacter beijingensis]|uniref:Helix-turn-helix domain-containing protein n=1 Tax=Pseudopedobacter beijingensis TaxID=1207056 RepID=A0ABW4IDC4_9SPHI